VIKKIEQSVSKIKILRVCAYVRVSTDSPDQLDSFQAQKKHYQSLIQANPSWTFVGIYSDEGISGTKTDRRFGLKEMMADARSGKIDLILTKSLSRFARNTVDTLTLIRELTKLGVFVRFEKENIDTSSLESELILSIVASLAEDESRSTSQNIKWSIEKKFKNGTYLPGYLPYGYCYVDNEIKVVPKEAEIVHTIYQLSINGKGSFRIAKELNQQSIPSPRNRAWSDSTILGILKNEFYTGDLLCQKTYTDEHFRRHRNQGEKAQYLIKNHHPAIVNDTLFNQAQKRIEARRKTKNQRNKTYPFTGMLRCAKCGANLKRRIHYSGEHSSIHWTCSEHLKSKDHCTQPSIAEQKIQWAFLTMLNKLMFASEQILSPLLELKAEEVEQKAEEKINELQMYLQDIAGQLQATDELKGKGLLNEKNFQKVKAELLQEHLRKTNELETLRKTRKKTHEKQAALEDLFLFAKKKESITDFDEDIWERFIDSAEVYERTTIIFYLKCGLILKEAL